MGITVAILIFSALVYRTNGDTWGAGGGGEAIGATLVVDCSAAGECRPNAKRSGQRIEGHYAVATQD